MFKKFLLAVVVVFVALEAMDFVLHGLILAGIYKETAAIWRPDMNKLMWAMYVVTFLSTIGFVYIYYKLINPKSPFIGVWYGLTFGFISGLGMGYGTYVMFPIPYSLAIIWFVGSIVCHGIAGWLTGIIIKEKV
ncbi:MAG: hypothetical protein A2X61_07540 [Ignavibacteria bacterium GWB2_35_12]|nr:MAG: hypothetical protein A2X63_12840 [Ignavibacteria bacterium GWA2_35_8]OGU39179.1 MAG: hypothetical protein A2X61_07540 [Ignavibacteria bacterium GWB2_35_12]OGU89207.1 MAG: hypothetical protein A2220_00930 [Ignavibacteria bacterium RIFOXYA2_FULL_35_10]OGV21045.1 MAG: hypothetical protein A2475_00830 [Ignavibacteria bacterium RIFOXYC2_FULL_35_21]